MFSKHCIYFNLKIIMLHDTPLDLSSDIGSKELINFQFCNIMQIHVFLSSHKEGGVWSVEIGFKWIHKQKLKSNSICTKSRKNVIIANWDQNSAWMNHKQFNSQHTSPPRFLKMSCICR
jgi:hypothetical protein